MGGASPAIFMMQQNTRLVIIALEVVRGMRLPTDVSLQQPAAPSSGSEDDEQPQAQPRQAQQVSLKHWVPGFVLACDPGEPRAFSQHAVEW